MGKQSSKKPAKKTQKLRKNLKELKTLENPHKSFKRSYREDYQRELNVPGVGEHIVKSFGMIFRNWKVFLPLLGLAVILSVLLVGVNGVLDEVAGVFGVLIFLLVWLTTIFLLRHIMAGHKVGLRDGLYNAMTPLVSTFVVFAVAVVQCVPIFLLIIAYSAAVETDFLATPFYALMFWGFAALMLTLSGYLLPSSLIALVAVTAPGLYPLRALSTAAELMMGRRIRFILRLVALILVGVAMWVVLVLPWTALNLPVEVMTVIVTIVACFAAIYMATYLYLYYRWMLDD